ncbi:hypothetical protein B0H15DRAFT_957495 [Mycena belliarum]|uniref:Uncharacterized protein n=1 Tax=Mycena belliarum TaxID=1033014 RepID=A0AAD6XLH1_9AGAR|nr:hypothetical protein B0H15DRAFT_957495 [Mycena belliae]
MSEFAWVWIGEAVAVALRRFLLPLRALGDGRENKTKNMKLGVKSRPAPSSLDSWHDDTSVAEGIVKDALPTPLRAPAVRRPATAVPHAHRCPRLRGSGNACGSASWGADVALAAASPSTPALVVFNLTSRKSRHAPLAAPATALLRDLECFGSCPRNTAMYPPPSSLASPHRARLRSPRDAAVADPGADSTADAPDGDGRRRLDAREPATMGLCCRNVQAALLVLHVTMSHAPTQPRPLPPPSIPSIVPLAPLPSANRTPHAAPPSDLGAAHAAPPVTPRFGVHARFLLVMWRLRVPRRARQSANAQVARSSTAARRALRVPTVRIAIPDPGGAFGRPPGANSSCANGAVLVLLPACALPTPSTAPPRAARAELPANPRVACPRGSGLWRWKRPRSARQASSVPSRAH